MMGSLTKNTGVLFPDEKVSPTPYILIVHTFVDENSIQEEASEKPPKLL